MNGTIYSGLEATPVGTALLVRDGIIAAIGSDEEILSMVQENAEIVDLKGKTVLPGFTDSHMHLTFYAAEKSLVALEEAESLEEVKSLLAADAARAKESGRWLRGAGFNQDNWDEAKLPTRLDLDEVSTEVPISIQRTCHHMIVVNTKALELMGLMNGPIPEELADCIGMFEDGTPDGVLRETAQNLIDACLPPITVEEMKELILIGCKNLAKKGIVEVQTDDFHLQPGEQGKTILAAYKELVAEDRLPIRVYEQNYLPTEEDIDSFLEAGNLPGTVIGRFRIGPLKVVMDGSLGSRSAYMRTPYLNAPDERGIANYTEEELYRLCLKGRKAGFHIATHCIGDGALERTLNVYERIKKEVPADDLRDGIVHCQIMDDAQTDKFKELDLIGYVQPIFVRTDMNIVDMEVGEALASQSYNWRRFLDNGTHISGGSDCPVEGFDIMENIRYAVTRKNYETGMAWYPENGVTLEEAVRMFTIEGAYASYSEKTRGSLEAGKVADLVVMDGDIYKTPIEDIVNLQILETVVDGITVYTAE